MDRANSTQVEDGELQATRVRANESEELSEVSEVTQTSTSSNQSVEPETIPKFKRYWDICRLDYDIKSCEAQKMEGVELMPQHTSVIEPVCEGVNKCFSCKRKQMEGAKDPYHLTFYSVPSAKIRSKGRFKLKHIKSPSANRPVRSYPLCEQCMYYLVAEDDVPKNMWPLFLYSVLFGWHRNALKGKTYHHSVCGGETLWRLIPQSMRLWWMDEIANHDAYNGCTLVLPPSVFEDKTLDLKDYNDEYNNVHYSSVRKYKKLIDCSVLCPWSCSTSCLHAGRISFDIVIQRMIPEVALMLFSNNSEKDYRLMHSSSSTYFQRYEKDESRKIKPTVLLEGDCLNVLTCEWHDGGRDKLMENLLDDQEYDM